MFCENCGSKIESSDKFCIKCGNALPWLNENITQSTKLDDRWWHRLFKVIYILLYIPLPFFLLIIWSANSSSYDYYTHTSRDTSGSAFLYSLITLFVYLALARLIKISFLYITMGKKPEWKKEFKRLF